MEDEHDEQDFEVLVHSEGQPDEQTVEYDTELEDRDANYLRGGRSV